MISFSPLFSALHLQREFVPFVDEPTWLVAASKEVVAVLVDYKSFPFICSFSPLFNALRLQLAPFVDEPLWLVSTAEVVAVNCPFFMYIFSSLAVLSLNRFRSHHPQIISYCATSSVS